MRISQQDYDARQAELTSEANRKLFLDTLSEYANVGIAAAATGWQKQNFYRWRSRDPEFAADWDAAAMAGAQGLLDEAKRRGIIGVQESVFHKGRVVGEVTKYSDVLLMFAYNNTKYARDMRILERRAIAAADAPPPPIAVLDLEADRDRLILTILQELPDDRRQGLLDQIQAKVPSPEVSI